MRDRRGNTIGKVVLLGITGLALYSPIHVTGSCVSHWREESRKDDLAELIKDANFDKSRRIIAEYRTEELLDPKDLTAMEIRLREADQSHARKQRDLERINKKKEGIGELAGLIQNAKYSEAQAMYKSLMGGKLLTEKEKGDFAGKLEAISKDRLWEDIQIATGLNKIKLLQTYVRAHATEEDKPQFRERILKTYLQTAESYFLTGVDSGKTLGLLRRFNKWVQGQDPEYIAGFDFSGFAEAGREYVKQTETGKCRKEFQLGDKVTVRKALGVLFGEGAKNYAFDNYTTDQVPINSQGTIIEVNNNGQSVKVSIKSGDGSKSTYPFIRQELEFDDGDVPEDFAEIYRLIGSISSSQDACKLTAELPPEAGAKLAEYVDPLDQATRGP